MRRMGAGIPAVITVAAASLVGLTAFPAAADCPETDPSVTVTARHVDAVVRNDRTERDLDAMSGVAAATTGSHGRALGLTTSRLGYRIDLDVTAGGTDGEVCVSATALMVEIAYTDTTIDVVRQYPPWSCQYEAIMDHELEHVRINHDTLNRYLGSIEQRVREELAAAFPVRAASIEAGQNAGAARIQATLDSAISVMVSDRDERHRRLDSGDSYAATAARCPEWP